MIIGLYGKKRAGKDYTGEMLGIHLDDAYMLHSFADRLKEYTKYIVREQWFDLIKLLESDFDKLDIPAHKLPKTVNHITALRRDPNALQLDSSGKHRWLLQRVGTEVFRDTVDKNYWVRILQANLTGHTNIITDVRFQNEADICNVVIYVEGGIGGDKHDSENATVTYDFHLDNVEKDPAYHLEQVKQIIHSDLWKNLTK